MKAEWPAVLDRLSAATGDARPQFCVEIVWSEEADSGQPEPKGRPWWSETRTFPGDICDSGEGVAMFGKTLQKDAPTDVEEIQRKEGQSRDPVHISVSVPLDSQLRHGKAEKVNSESATFSTVPGIGIQNTEGAAILQKSLKSLVAPARIELTTNGLGNRCSIQLSYGATDADSSMPSQRCIRDV